MKTTIKTYEGDVHVTVTTTHDGVQVIELTQPRDYGEDETVYIDTYSFEQILNYAKSFIK